MHIRAILLLITVSLFSGCGGPELVTGRNPAGDRTRIIEKDTFVPGEPMAIVLRNARFRDNLTELVIYSINRNGRRFRSRTIRLPSIDTSLDYLRIPEGLFFLPFPGKYIIAVKALGETIAETTVTVRPLGK